MNCGNNACNQQDRKQREGVVLCSMFLRLEWTSQCKVQVDEDKTVAQKHQELADIIHVIMKHIYVKHPVVRLDYRYKVR